MITIIGRAALVLLFVAALAAPYHAAQNDAAEKKTRAEAQKAFDEGKKLSNADHYRDAIDRFQKAHDLSKRLGDYEGQAQALEMTGRMYQVFGKDFEKALDAFERALEAAFETGNEKLEAAVLGDVATAHKLLEDYPNSVKAYEQALEIYRKLEDHAAEVATVSNLAGVYAAAGDTVRSDEHRAMADELRGLYKLPAPTVRVSGGVLYSKALKRPQPSYPLEAQQKGVEGEVIVEITVSTEGIVESAKALSGPPELQDASIQAARGWTFSPIMISRERVRMIGTISFKFRRA